MAKSNNNKIHMGIEQQGSINQASGETMNAIHWLEGQVTIMKNTRQKEELKRNESNSQNGDMEEIAKLEAELNKLP